MGSPLLPCSDFTRFGVGSGGWVFPSSAGVGDLAISGVLDSGGASGIERFGVLKKQDRVDPEAARPMGSELGCFWGELGAGMRVWLATVAGRAMTRLLKAKALGSLVG